MKIKYRHIIVTIICYGLIIGLLPIFEYLTDRYDNLWFSFAMLLIEFGLLMAMMLYSQYKTEKAVLRDDFTPSGEPVLEIRNRFTRKVTAWLTLQYIAWDVVFLYIFTIITGDFPWGGLALCVLFAPYSIYDYRSRARSSYTFRSDRLLVKEFRLGKQTADLDIPLEQITDLRYRYMFAANMEQWLLLEVNGNKMEIHTFGCAEQIAQEVIARQRQIGSH